MDNILKLLTLNILSSPVMVDHLFLLLLGQPFPFALHPIPSATDEHCSSNPSLSPALAIFLSIGSFSLKNNPDVTLSPLKTKPNKNLSRSHILCPGFTLCVFLPFTVKLDKFIYNNCLQFLFPPFS